MAVAMASGLVLNHLFCSALINGLRAPVNSTLDLNVMLPTGIRRANVQREMAEPRMASSARIAELNLNTTRIPERPSSTVPGIVDKIIPSPGPGQPEEAQTAVEGGGHRYRDLVSNTLTDEHGEDVRLKKGVHVEVTVTAEPKTSI
jgi:hypothetical protein